MYLGEITRRILVKFGHETGLFGGVIPSMQAEGALTTPDTSKIDHDSSFMGGPTAEILQETLGLTQWQTLGHRQLVIVDPKPQLLSMFTCRTSLCLPCRCAFGIGHPLHWAAEQDA